MKILKLIKKSFKQFIRVLVRDTQMLMKEEQK